MLNNLKKEVYEANMALPKYGLVLFTWGNVSGIDRAGGHIVIKPSGVDYDKLSPDDMVVTDLDGYVVEGSFKPSSDTPSHVALYKNFPEIGGIAHTHSTYATSCAQAGIAIEPFGTTHADYFNGKIPVTRHLSEDEIANDYEKHTGLCITELFKKNKLNENEIPGALVRNHGPFVWAKDANTAAHNAAVLEEIAKMFILTKLANPEDKPVVMPGKLLKKHFYRKHGALATYGQKNG